jgi:tetratricopeptide (TPR) repeat protein
LGDFYKIINIKSNIGSMHNDTGEYELSQKVLLSALAEVQKFGNLDSEAYIRHTLGYSYVISQSGKNPEAVELLEKAIEIYNRIDSKWDISATESELALAYLALGQYENAEKHAELGFNHASDQDSQYFDHDLKAYAQYVKAKVFTATNRDTEALEQFIQANKQFKKSDMKAWLATSYKDLALLLHKFGRNAESRKLFLEAQSLYNVLNLQFHLLETKKIAQSVGVEI